MFQLLVSEYFSGYLVESVVQAFIEVVQVAEDDGVAQLHGNLDSVDVEADLTVFLIVGETRSEDDGGVCHVQQLLKN